MAETLQRKNRKIVDIFQTILSIVISVFSVISIAVCSTIIFHTRYYETFWVNGQSMYPTLNLNAKRKDGTVLGNNKDHALSPSSEEGDYDVDYGYMDTHKSVINSLKRFDIIVLKFGDDDDSKRLIKRVIALPGETFYIVNGGENNGDLYIQTKSNDEVKWDLVSQPIDISIVRGGDYSYPTYNNQATGYTVPENCYFVMGDNRYAGCSSDSRNNGPYHKENIEGKAIGLEGRCTVGVNEKGKLVATNVKHRWMTRF